MKVKSSEKIRRSTGFDTSAMLYQLSYEATHFLRLLLSSCLNWKIYCDDQISLSYTIAVQIWIISYKLHIISLHEKIRTQWIDLAPNVWLHSSVGRASHRYRGCHGFESRWSPDFFQASSFQLFTLENLLRWSNFTFIYNRSTNMNFTSFHCTRRYELNKLTSLPMCGFIHVAQLVEHRTGIAEVTGSNPVEALIFSGFFFPIA